MSAFVLTGSIPLAPVEMQPAAPLVPDAVSVFILLWVALETCLVLNSIAMSCDRRTRVKAMYAFWHNSAVVTSMVLLMAGMFYLCFILPY